MISDIILFVFALLFLSFPAGLALLVRWLWPKRSYRMFCLVPSLALFGHFLNLLLFPIVPSASTEVAVRGDELMSPPWIVASILFLIGENIAICGPWLDRRRKQKERQPNQALQTTPVTRSEI